MSVLYFCHYLIFKEEKLSKGSLTSIFQNLQWHLMVFFNKLEVLFAANPMTLLVQGHTQQQQKQNQKKKKNRLQ